MPILTPPVYRPQGPLRIGVTGSISCGKDLVADLMSEQGALVINADGVYHGLLECDQTLRAKLRESFGETIVPAIGPVNRKALGRIVYSDSEAMTTLVSITHPRIRGEILRLMEEPGPEPRVLNAPLLVDMGLDQWMDTVVVVVVDSAIQVQRLMARDSIDRNFALAKISSQLSSSEKSANADFVLDNSGSIGDTRKKVVELWPRLIERAMNRRRQWQN